MLKYGELPSYALQEKYDKEIYHASGSNKKRLLKLCLFKTVVAVGITVFLVKPVICQEHSQVNSPPILVVPDRNWRISETEPVGQIISRIRADDFENDKLIYGLELAYKGLVNPFRIDPVAGVVYLNQSLIGRGGENFFLYVTVTDGKLTAKNEVYVNILSTEEHTGSRSRLPAISIPQSVHNITHFLPSFDSLPGVQSIRNQQLNRRPSYVLQSGLNNIFLPPTSKFNPNQQVLLSSIDNAKESIDERDINYSVKITTPQSISTTTRRTRLTPISYRGTSISASKNSTEKESTAIKQRNTSLHSINTTSVFYSFGSQTFSLLLTAFGLFVAAAVIVGFLYRKRLCAFGKTLKKTSQEKLAKKSNQTILNSSRLTDDSSNSMVMQQWNGPMAYGNRYVPCELDQQLQQQMHSQQHILQESIATIQLSNNIANGGSDSCHPAVLGVTVSEPTSAIATVTSACSYRFGERNLTQQKIYDIWEFPRHRLKFFNILGEGAFGQVWRCEAMEIGGSEGVTTVAVKTIRENATEVERKDLLSELEVMKSLEPHLNVVRFLGCCTDKDPIFVIMEYVNRGKLQTYLRSSRAERHYGNTHAKSNILTSGDLTSFMYQIAKGMDYLTSRGIIHRDLAARNVLIADDHTCKVADFGFARDIITSKIYERKSEGKLPIRWMAIESLYDNIFSVKSDIWSFGILMWEIVTLGATPYPGVSASEVMRKVQNGYRLEKPEHCRRELYNIMYYCWSHDPNKRPSFGELINMLDKLLHTEMDYIELERFPDHNYYNVLNLSNEKV